MAGTKVHIAFGLVPNDADQVGPGQTSVFIAYGLIGPEYVSSSSSTSVSSESSESSESSISSTSSTSSESSTSSVSSTSVSSTSSESSVSSESSESSPSSESSVSSESSSRSKIFVSSSSSSKISISSSSVSMNDDCIKAQITAQFKSRLKTISGIAAVEEKRAMLQVNDRWPFILIEEDPIDEADNLQLQQLEYFVWYFPNSADQLVGNPGADNDTEAAYLARNAIANITVALNKDIYVAGLALNVEVDPGTDEIYMDGEVVLFGVWCKVIVTTNIEETDQYQNW